MISRVVDTLEIWQIRKKHETREESVLLLSALQTFSFFFPFMKILTAKKIWTLFSVRQIFGIWMTFLQRQIESLVADAVPKATDICEEMGIATERRIRRRRLKKMLTAPLAPPPPFKYATGIHCILLPTVARGGETLFNAFLSLLSKYFCVISVKHCYL